MKTATRVVFNTVILYVKILITMAISLVTVPLVLHTLGKSDYGLYSLVGGIIAMLAFLNNSMSVATQRFMSVAMGEGNVEKINKVYNVNIKLHLLLGVLVVVGLEIIEYRTRECRKGQNHISVFNYNYFFEYNMCSS